MSANGSMLQRLRDATQAHYEELPSLAQDVVCSAYGAQEIVRRRGRAVDAERYMRGVETLFQDPEASKAIRERRLRTILDLARRLPGYEAPPPVRDRSALEELQAWPVLTKGALRRGPAAYLTREPRAVDIPSLTSGTSGTPIKIWRPRAAFRELFRSSTLSRAWFGIPFNCRRASFTGKLVAPVSSDRVWRLNLPGRQMVLSQYHLAARYARDYARVLSRWRPHYLDGYTSNLVELGRLLQQAGLMLQIPLIVTTCEMLTPSGRRLLEDRFGGRVADKYGSSENVVLAAECPAGMRHVFPHLGLIEVVDDRGRRVRRNEPGRLLLTTLTNDLMPLIRYEVGDVGVVEEDVDCPCGRESSVLREIEGRADDVIISNDGRRVSIFAFNLLRGLEGVVAMQVVQRNPRSFEVRATLENREPETRATFERAIRQSFDRLLGPDPTRLVHVAYEESIERSPGGKIRKVLRAF